MIQNYGRWFARCVKQLGFYTVAKAVRLESMFARCVKQLGFYTVAKAVRLESMFARCVKQLGFYTVVGAFFTACSLLGVLNN